MTTRKRSAASTPRKAAPRRSERPVGAPKGDPCALPAVMDEGASGDAVVALQLFLQTQGVSTPVTSVFDAETRRAVQRLQRQMHPVYSGPVDGLWTKRTRAAACGLYA